MPLQALLPRGPGHQFVLYGDSCSGIQGEPNETTFASVHAVVRRLAPQPEFVLFLGDEVAGLTADTNEPHAQWRHWLDQERLNWLGRWSIGHGQGGRNGRPFLGQDLTVHVTNAQTPE